MEKGRCRWRAIRNEFFEIMGAFKGNGPPRYDLIAVDRSIFDEKIQLAPTDVGNKDLSRLKTEVLLRVLVMNIHLIN